MLPAAVVLPVTLWDTRDCETEAVAPQAQRRPQDAKAGRSAGSPAAALGPSALPIMPHGVLSAMLQLGEWCAATSMPAWASAAWSFRPPAASCLVHPMHSTPAAGATVAQCEAAGHQQYPSAASVSMGVRRHERMEERQQAQQQQQWRPAEQGEQPSQQQQQQQDQQLPTQQEQKGRLAFTRPSISPVALTAQHPREVAELRALASTLWAEQRGETAELARRSALIIATAAETGCGPEEKRSGRGSLPPAAPPSPPTPAGLPPRFTDTELMRFAVLAGWTRARSDAEREAALRRAAEQVCRTAAWLAHHRFADEAELTRFRQLIYWAAPDAEGRPTLHIRLAAAVDACRGPEAITFANAIITHMQHAHAQLLRDGGPEQINVVMDCGDAPTMAAARISWVFKAVSLTLNHHYPTRWVEGEGAAGKAAPCGPLPSLPQFTTVVARRGPPPSPMQTAACSPAPPPFAGCTVWSWWTCP